jgi:hypothetical protein
MNERSRKEIFKIDIDKINLQIDLFIHAFQNLILDENHHQAELNLMSLPVLKMRR